jgi:hypothetical protein
MTWVRRGKQIGTLKELNGNGTGAPRSPERTWAEKDGEADQSFCDVGREASAGARKSNRNISASATYAEVTWISCAAPSYDRVSAFQ